MVRFFRRKGEGPAEPAAPAAPEPSPEPVAAVSEAPRSVDQAIERTRRTWFSRIGGLFARGLGDALWGGVGGARIAGGTGGGRALPVVGGVRGRAGGGAIREPETALAALKGELAAILSVDGGGRLWGAAGSPFAPLILREPQDER